MKILTVGDLVGEIGVNKAKEMIREIKNKENIDFIIVNAENSADGMGITEKIFKDLLSTGANVITIGKPYFGKERYF